jgi:hypothetical protein
VHRLSDKGVLVARHHCFGFMYSIAQGATRPTDGRGRPRKSEQSTRRLESSPGHAAQRNVRLGHDPPNAVRLAGDPVRSWANAGR